MTERVRAMFLRFCSRIGASAAILLAMNGCGGYKLDLPPPLNPPAVTVPPPIPAVGTQWIYSLTYSDSTTHSGTLTLTYLGTQTFHGIAYYALQAADSLQSPTYTVSYMQPTFSGFAEYGAVLNQAPYPPGCPNTDQAEDTLDTARSFYGSASGASGTRNAGSVQLPDHNGSLCNNRFRFGNDYPHDSRRNLRSA